MYNFINRTITALTSPAMAASNSWAKAGKNKQWTHGSKAKPKEIEP
jgi:hypothetical protein